MEITAVESVAIEDLLDLYGSVEWGAYTSDPAGLERAVAGSTYVVTARHEGQLIGLARGLSDDVSIFYLQDILVRREWQRRGVGGALLADCLTRFAHVRSKVLVTDDEDRQHRFYRAMGYQEIGDAAPPGTLHAFIHSGDLT
jgi:GNAT superfamily N-acetyltransferase